MTTHHHTHSSPARRYDTSLGLIATLFCALGAAAVPGCAGADSDEPLGRAEGALFGSQGSYWPAGANGVTTVPVCWQFAGYDLDKQYVRSAVEGQWGAVSSVQFVGWGLCGAGTPANAIRIQEADVGPHTLGLGTHGAGIDMTLNFHYNEWNSYTHLNCSCPWFDAECAFDSAYNYGTCDHCDDNHAFCDGLIALHEFGHALGMYHEQQRPENADGHLCDEFQPGETVGPADGDPLTPTYDKSSIMNYCETWNRTVPKLSAGDQAGLRAQYGTAPSALTAQVLIYEDVGYGRSAQALYPGVYNASALKIGNDKLSSVRVPPGWSVRLYRDDNLSGAFVDLSADAPDLGDRAFNDVTSSILVSGPLTPSPVLYKDSAFSGQGQRLYPGVYNAGDLAIGNDEASSLSVPGGWSVTLYKDSNFKGESVTYTASTGALLGLNDEVSSVKVVGPPGTNPVIVFKDADYSGPAQALWPGRYMQDDLTIGNDDLTSMIVPAGWSVSLTQNDPFWGELRTYTSSTSSVSGTGFNDRTSGVVVRGPTP
jgi:hypothetical protein